MSMSRTKEEQELNERLIKELVGPQVMEPMEALKWGHGAPPAPTVGTTPPAEGAQVDAQGTTPASGQPAVGSSPATTTTANTPDLLAQMESLRDAGGKILGKYLTPQDAIKGVGHAVTMAKDAFGKRDAAEQEVTRLRNELNTLRTQPPATPAGAPVSASPQLSRTEVDAARNKLSSLLLSIAKDDGILDESRAQLLADAQIELSEVQARFALAESTHNQRVENARWSEADAYMEQHHPESLNFVDEISLHVQSDPLLQDIVAALAAQGKEGKASEAAWKSYQQHVNLQTTTALVTDATTKEATLAAGEQVRKELVDNARKDAGIISGSAGGQGTHERPQTDMSSEERAILQEQMRREGGTPGTAAGAAFRRALLPDVFRTFGQ
jgi:hypothetical protein